MLVLTRKLGEKILIGDDIVITVVEAGKSRLKLGITAPAGTRVLRSELDPGRIPAGLDCVAGGEEFPCRPRGAAKAIATAMGTGEGRVRRLTSLNALRMRRSRPHPEEPCLIEPPRLFSPERSRRMLERSQPLGRAEVSPRAGRDPPN